MSVHVCSCLCMLLYDWSASPFRSGLIRRKDGVTACTSDPVQSDKTDGWTHCMYTHTHTYIYIYICMFVLSAEKRFEVAQDLVHGGTCNVMMLGRPSHHTHKQNRHCDRQSGLSSPHREKKSGSRWMDSVTGRQHSKKKWPAHWCSKAGSMKTAPGAGLGVIGVTATPWQ